MKKVSFALLIGFVLSSTNLFAIEQGQQDTLKEMKPQSFQQFMDDMEDLDKETWGYCDDPDDCPPYCSSREVEEEPVEFSF